MGLRKVAILVLFALLAYSIMAFAQGTPTGKAYIILLEDGVSKDIVSQYGTITHKFTSINAVTTTLEPEKAEQLKLVIGVKSVEEDQVIEVGSNASNPGQTIQPLKAMSSMASIFETLTVSQWNLTEQGINAEAAWNQFNVDGDGVKIAIIDSGVNYTLPEISSNYLGGRDFCVNGTGNSCSGEDNDPIDVYGHGTQMATAMLSNTGQINGVAPQAQYYALKITNSDTNSKTSTLLKALDWVDVNSDAKIIYMGVYSFISPGLLNFFINKNARFLFVAPSYAPPKPEYPALDIRVIGIGAHTKNLPQGITIDTGNYADILAPGEEVPVVDLNGNRVDASDRVGVAAAQAAGALALMVDYNRMQGLDLNNADLNNLFSLGAIKLNTGDPKEGHGKVDINKAISMMIPSVACTLASDCGTSGPAGDAFCQSNDKYVNFVTYVCNNPSLPGAYCSSNSDIQLSEDCRETTYEDWQPAYCDGNSVARERIVHNGGCAAGACINNDSTEKQATQECSYGCRQGACIVPACFANEDCGTDTQVGGLFCQENNVFQDIETHTCVNPGTAQANCVAETVAQPIEVCGTTTYGEWSQNACSAEGNVIQTRTVNNKGCEAGTCTSSETTETQTIQPCQYGCNNGTCIVPACLTNTDCGIDGPTGEYFCQGNGAFQNNLAYTCQNPATAQAQCVVETVPHQEQDCGTTTTSDWSQNYCTGNDIMQERIVYNRGCESGACTYSETTEKQTIQTCQYGCSDGQCITPTCFANTDCGTDGFVGGLFCQEGDSFQNYATHTCLNPGTPQAQCAVETNPALLNDCGTTTYEEWSQEQCSTEGNVIQTRTVNNKGCNEGTCTNNDTTETQTTQTCTYGCNNGACIVPACFTNTDCGTDGFVDGLFCQEGNVLQNYITYNCVDAGTANATCTSQTAPQTKQDCGTTTYGEWSQNACSAEGNIIQTRTVNNKGCEAGTCTSTETTETQTMQNCQYGCNNGACIVPACFANTDCGTDGYTNGLFCQEGNLFQNYTTYACNNAGTANASCSSQTIPQMTQDCGTTTNGEWGGAFCNGNIVMRERTVSNRGCDAGACTLSETTEAEVVEECANGCNNGACTVQINCSADSDCGNDIFTGPLFCQENNVFQDFLNYTCNNPGTSQSYCSNTTVPQLKQECQFGCNNGACNTNPDLLELNCPTAPIGPDYTFTWASPATRRLSMQVGTEEQFTPRSFFSIAVTGKSLPLTNQFQRFVTRERQSETGELFARLYATTASGERKYSNVCSFTLQQPAQTVLQCPVAPVNNQYSFAWNVGDYNANVRIQFSSDENFARRTTMRATQSPTAITPVYGALVRSSNGSNLYARVASSDRYGRQTYSNVCNFALVQPIQPVLECPTTPINRNYSFSWNAGDYTDNTRIEFSNTQLFLREVNIQTNESPTPIAQRYDAIRRLVTNPNSTVYARFFGRDQYNRTTYSNVCAVKLG